MLIRNGIVLVEEIEQQKQEKAQQGHYLCRHLASAPYSADRLHHRSVWPLYYWMSSSRVWR
jgi:hypothetical protein